MRCININININITTNQHLKKIAHTHARAKKNANLHSHSSLASRAAMMTVPSYLVCRYTAFALPGVVCIFLPCLAVHSTHTHTRTHANKNNTTPQNYMLYFSVPDISYIMRTGRYINTEIVYRARRNIRNKPQQQNEYCENIALLTMAI